MAVSKRKDVLIAAGVFVLALAIRLAYVWQAQANPLFDHPNLDAALHDRWARAILNGEDLFPGPYFRAPLYPWFLAGIYAIGGPGFLLPRIVQAVTGALSCVVVWLIGREAFGRATGVLAGLAAATYWVFIYFDGELLLEPLSILLNTLGIWLLLRGLRGGQVVSWMLAGLALGLSAIDRPNVLMFMPAAALWMVYLHRAELRRGLVRAGLFALACAVPILPLAVRNYLVGHDLVLISWQGGPNFYIGNNPQSDGMTAVLPGARADWWGGLDDWIALAEGESGRRLKPSEVSQFYYAKARRFFAEQPGLAVDLMVHKLRLFWNNWEIPNPTYPHYFTTRFAPWVLWLPLRFGIVAPLALIGLWFTRRGVVQQAPLWSFGLVYMATVVAYFVTSRFRLPVVPVLIVYAAGAVVEIGRLVRARAWRAVGQAAFAGAVLAFLMNTDVPVQAQKDAEAQRMVGEAWMSIGEHDRALAEFRGALERYPQCARAFGGIGLVYLKQGDYREAIDALRQALSLDPSPAQHDTLALALQGAGRYAEALATLRAGVAATPGYLDLRRRLAWMLATCPQADVRDGREAVRIAEEVVARGGAVPATLDTLAAAYAEAGRFADAIKTAQRAVDLASLGGDTATAELIAGRLSAYRRGEAYYETGAAPGGGKR